MTRHSVLATGMYASTASSVIEQQRRPECRGEQGWAEGEKWSGTPGGWAIHPEPPSRKEQAGTGVPVTVTVIL
jgi:hypothetical protein